MTAGTPSDAPSSRLAGAGSGTARSAGTTVHWAAVPHGRSWAAEPDPHARSDEALREALADLVDLPGPILSGHLKARGRGPGGAGLPVGGVHAGHAQAHAHLARPRLGRRELAQLEHLVGVAGAFVDGGEHRQSSWAGIEATIAPAVPTQGVTRRRADLGSAAVIVVADERSCVSAVGAGGGVRGPRGTRDRRRWHRGGARGERRRSGGSGTPPTVVGSAPQTATATKPPPEPRTKLTALPPAERANGTEALRVGLSGPVAPGSPRPRLTPAVAGSWRSVGDAEYFRPAATLAPCARYALSVPAGTRASGERPLGASRRVDAAGRPARPYGPCSRPWRGSGICPTACARMVRSSRGITRRRAWSPDWRSGRPRGSWSPTFRAAPPLAYGLLGPTTAGGARRLRGRSPPPAGPTRRTRLARACSRPRRSAGTIRAPTPSSR